MSVRGRAPGGAARPAEPWWRRADRIFVLPSRAELFRAVAGRIAGIARERAASLHRAGGGRGAIHLALSGGSAGEACGALADAPYREMFPWDLVHFWQVDERWVPGDDPRNNGQALRERLFARVPAPPGNLHLVDTSLPGPSEGARRYEDALRRLLPGGPGGFPRFDAVVLGIGADGHTASLFPGGPALLEATRCVTDVSGGDPPVPRVTLTLPVLNAASHAIFVVAGREKAAIVRAILSGEAAALPAARVTLPRGTVTFLADARAAPAAKLDDKETLR